MKQAIAYYRVSTGKQEKSGLGLETQQHSVKHYARMAGFTIVRELTEIESGRSTRRPVIKEAIAFCNQSKAVLLIATVDRLARNVVFIASLMESKTQFVAVDCPDADDLFLHMKAVYAQYEHKKISERTKATMQVAKQRGAVFGTSCKQLAMNNKQAAYDFAVKMAPIIASLRKQGFKTVRAMAKELNRRKIPTARQLLPSLSCPRWHITTVYALLLRIQDMGNGTTDI